MFKREQCIAENNFYRLCLCADGFSGVDCEIDLGKCSLSSPDPVYKESMFKREQCIAETVSVYRGFSGVDCEIDLSE